jgi:hypothetical protein
MIRWILDGMGRITGEKPVYDKTVRKVLRETFRTPEGREALAFIITDLGFFDEAKTPSGELLTGEAAIRANALRDYARRMLEMMGVFHEGHARELVNQIIDLPVWEKKRSQEES